MRLAIKAVRFTSRTILSLLLFLSLVLLLPAAAGYRPYIVTSGSMEPSIPAGSLIYVKPTGFDRLKEGMVITYVLPSGSPVITHRIVRTDPKKNRVFTKGDANSQEDASPVYGKQVIGKAAWYIPVIGFFLLTAGNRRGKRLVLIWCLLFLITARRKSRVLSRSSETVNDGTGS